MSIVEGAGLITATAGTNYQVKVTARDTAGAYRNFGGDIFVIKIQNECAQTTGWTWEPVSNQKTVLQTEITAQMYDNLDGTYHYNYSVDLDGNITISVLLFLKDGLRYEFFDSSDWTGAVGASGIHTQVDSYWATGVNITPTRSDYVTGRWQGAIKAPITGTVTLYFEWDDTWTIYINDQVFMTNGLGNFTKTSKYIFYLWGL